MNKNGLHSDTNNFGLPKDYFADFDSRLRAEIKLRELMPEDDGFAVPAGYFAASRQKLLQTGVKRKVFRLPSKTVGAMLAIAAAIILALLVVTPQRVATPSFETLSLNTLDAYLDQGDITEYLLEEDAAFLENTSTLDQTGLDEETIINYLDNYPLDEVFIDQ